MAVGKIFARLIGAVGLFAWLSVPTSAATVEESLAVLDKLPAKERQRRLEEGARKEGSLVVYSNHGVETTQEYAQMFSEAEQQV